MKQFRLLPLPSHAQILLDPNVRFPQKCHRGLEVIHADSLPLTVTLRRFIVARLHV